MGEVPRLHPHRKATLPAISWNAIISARALFVASSGEVLGNTINENDIRHLLLLSSFSFSVIVDEPFHQEWIAMPGVNRFLSQSFPVLDTGIKVNQIVNQKMEVWF